MDYRDGRCLLGSLLPIILLLAFLPGTAAERGPDSETCLECHDGYEGSLTGGAHQLGKHPDATIEQIECADCHRGGDAHVYDPSVANITGFSGGSVPEQARICRSCHQAHPEMGVAGLDPHDGQDVGCADCHNIHRQGPGLDVDRAAGMCDRCHVAVVRQFQRRSNHPLIDGVVSCVSCHNPTGANEPSLGHGGNANCYSCHPEQSGPFAYEHQAGSSFGPEGDGCTACHSPHGSSNERLLHQPDGRLCRQCHGEPALHRTQHGGLATAFDCMDCHSEVHGSYHNRALLDPDLGTKLGSGPGACYCHNVDN